MYCYIKGWYRPRTVVHRLCLASICAKSNTQLMKWFQFIYHLASISVRKKEFRKKKKKIYKMPSVASQCSPVSIEYRQTVQLNTFDLTVLNANVLWLFFIRTSHAAPRQASTSLYKPLHISFKCNGITFGFYFYCWIAYPRWLYHSVVCCVLCVSSAVHRFVEMFCVYMRLHFIWTRESENSGLVY